MRDYDPTTGRYIQADPLGLVDGASVYGYVGQNPGRHTDPRGENHLTSNGRAKCDLFRVTGIWGGAPNWCNEPKPVPLGMCIEDEERCSQVIANCKEIGLAQHGPGDLLPLESAFIG